MLFNELEDMSKTHHISDYSLSQTTLEQVFLEFSREAANITSPRAYSLTNNGNGNGVLREKSYLNNSVIDVEF